LLENRQFQYEVFRQVRDRIDPRLVVELGHTTTPIGVDCHHDIDFKMPAKFMARFEDINLTEGFYTLGLSVWSFLYSVDPIANLRKMRDLLAVGGHILLITRTHGTAFHNIDAPGETLWVTTVEAVKHFPDLLGMKQSFFAQNGNAAVAVLMEKL